VPSQDQVEASRPAIDIVLDQVGRLWESALQALPNLGIACVVMLVGWMVARAVAMTVRTAGGHFSDNPYLGSVISRLVKLAVLIAFLLISMSVVFPSFTPASLVQLLGISSVAIGFAFRDIFQNFLAGILLLITRPFRIGDQIVWANEQGTVEDIQTRATLVKTYDGRRLVIPNANLFTNAVTVNTAFPQRRMEYDIEVPRDQDLEALRGRIRSLVEGVTGVLGTPTVEVLLVELKPAMAVLRVRWWIAPPRNEDVLASKDLVLSRLLPLMRGPA